MAEVENINPIDIPKGSTSCQSEASGGATDLGISPPTQGTSNSHPHDSEYDTASDLEGGDDYDDDDDIDDDADSLTDEDDLEDDDEDDDEFNAAPSTSKIDPETQKKVDEDRSNPQYIPKRGTFYEHDDRTADVIGDGTLIISESGEQQNSVGTAGAKAPQSPIIEQGSKTLKKWQPASAVERWSHDRFDNDEQAPKTRSELVSAYGYDIRTEDAPPRARRRRRYGRGPSKYSRNWEDGNAYLKASNKERKPPRPSDFPALNERSNKTQRKPKVREEKENRLNRRQNEAVTENQTEKSNTKGPRNANTEDRRDRGDIKQNKGRNYGRQNVNNGRQAPMEFKQQKQRNNQGHQDMNNRNDTQIERQINRSQSNGVNNEVIKNSGKLQNNAKYPQPHQIDYNNVNNNSNINKTNESNFQQIQPTPQQKTPIRQTLPIKTVPTTQLPPTNLSQRLQQVQNRNDPSHVGSVQMHALATQNQIVTQQQQQQQQQTANIMVPQSTQPQEQRGPPKRYSSLRRSQHEAQHLADQHQLQMQYQTQHQTQQQPQMILQDQHMLQANLMHLYHQENLQAQMQAMQVTQTPPQPKQPAYATVPPQTQAPTYGNTAGPAPAPTAYYVTTPEAYAATANAQGPQATPYAQPTNYLQPAAAGAPLGYAATAPTNPQNNAPTSYPTAAVTPVAAPGATQPQQPNSNQNYANYQNFNTVGGTTYFVPPAQTASRPVTLPQRRPTNAIPILPPSEKNKQRAPEVKDELKNNGTLTTVQSTAPIGSADNIDHIIDNMFVQRPSFQPPQVTSTRKSTSPPTGENITNTTSVESANASSAQPDEVASNTTTNASEQNATSNNNPIAVQE